MDLDNFDQRNKVLVDWFSCTAHYKEPRDFIDELGLDSLNFARMDGYHGFVDRFYYNGISIHYNNKSDKSLVWLEMSGQGCRVYETFSPSGFMNLFCAVVNHKWNVTRLDLAYDDIQENILDIDVLVQDTLDGFYVSRFRSWSVTQSSGGKSIVHGSPKSDVLIRIYDKAAERHMPPGVHWVRVEFQLRDDRATECMQYILERDIGEVFAGVLHNYLWYAERTNDSNKSRWKMADYWQRLIDGVGKIQLFAEPGTEYNLDRCKKYVINQAGNAVDTLLRIFGKDDFRKMVEQRKIKPNIKYEQLVDQYGELIEP